MHIGIGYSFIHGILSLDMAVVLCAVCRFVERLLYFSSFWKNTSTAWMLTVHIDVDCCSHWIC